MAPLLHRAAIKIHNGPLRLGKIDLKFNVSNQSIKENKSRATAEMVDRGTVIAEYFLNKLTTPHFPGGLYPSNTRLSSVGTLA